MGHKVNPVGLRMGIIRGWDSKWFDKKDYKKNLKQDITIRNVIMDKWKPASISGVEIERSVKMIKIIIKTARPGVLIGRGGSGIEDLKRYVQNYFFKNSRSTNLKVEVQEIKNFEESASIVAQNIAEQLEKRKPFKKVMKSMADQVMKKSGNLGVKIELAGRLGGAEMSRKEWTAKGRLPLHTLRADIDFSRKIAFTSYGTLGVKVWIYKGEVFSKKSEEEKKEEETRNRPIKGRKI
ncbi:MAG: 30S ribosomal protein S3 [Candidatus Moranbacteria bacterium CG_4_8_14_3_um_filter_34_16]|nr:MAG: 30S ribosomal protein S3 [Candidatus Moranbacteria bacterium CG08_land_8_20_14_0_20_34_16]PIW95284.1 MAG: 30S ribosomal protein S3 [Candidatus Moranbacteria bacterium CG_4_8_14_3_um_filter_34_16]PJA89230.1 MAG: 30S ribosomal protein S3 [Candidatus Moranbacteria bacterium CG_4_9_14_3_um_filter_33_15]